MNDVDDDRRQMPDVLLVDEHVHDQREQREEEVLGELKPEQGLQVQTDVEVVIAEDRPERASRPSSGAP